MTGVETVVFAFAALGKAAQTVKLTQRIKAPGPAGEDLVYVRLMSHIPDYLILRRVKYLVQSDGQLHHSQVGSQVPAGSGHVFDEKISDRIRQKLHLL